MLVSAKEMLVKAKKGKYAVGQFNINNLEWTKAILLTAQENNSPVILGVSEGAGKYMCGYKTIVGMVEGMLEELNITVPVALHLDHGSFEGAKETIAAGFSSVMFDGSHYGIEENVEKTKEIVALAHSKGISVEAEVGSIGGEEDGVVGAGEVADPAECKRIADLGIDFLAAGIGNIHGKYPENWAGLNFEVLGKINEATGDMPLVLHGGSGIPDEMIKEDKKIYEAEKKQEAEQLSMFDTPLMSGKAKADYRIIGQLFETYWLIEYEDKFYMMDQHAAHEKILYERFMNHLKVKDMDTQMIMPPVIIELNMQQEDAYKRNKQAFSRLGFEIEEFGGNAYKVNGLPAGLPNINLKQMLIDMIDGLTDDNSTDLDIITERVATMSCKAAVKGNNKLSFEEAKELIEELMQAENPYNCPHGRPTLIVMSKYEVERKFKRIL